MTDTDSLYLPAGTSGYKDDGLLITPKRAGWTYSGLRVFTLEPGGSRAFGTGDLEMALLPLSGSCIVVAEDDTYELEGRASVFDRVTDFLYVGIDSTVRVTSDLGGEFAMCTAKATERFEPKYGPAEDVVVENRGGGQATRQINNFMRPGDWDHAHKLSCVEVLTPDGNWSSYPPHKHDDSPECEVNNEEIYYFRIGEAGTSNYSDKGFGMHRTYTGPLDDHSLEIDANVTVFDGDAFLVPRGYHGPCIAAPGYPMYYLNVLAGPDEDRSMAFCDDPAHHWIRDTFDDDGLDPRCPMTDSEGRIGG